jgi:hypothetical protein
MNLKSQLSEPLLLPHEKIDDDNFDHLQIPFHLKRRLSLKKNGQ